MIALLAAAEQSDGWPSAITTIAGFALLGFLAWCFTR